MPPRSDIIEGMAITAAVACLAHCLALPLILAAMPALAVVMPVPESFHIVALVTAMPTTLAALWIGYRHHRLAAPLVAGGVGLCLLGLGAITFGQTAAEMPVTVVGSLFIAGAHLANWQNRRRAATHG